LLLRRAPERGPRLNRLEQILRLLFKRREVPYRVLEQDYNKPVLAHYKLLKMQGPRLKAQLMLPERRPQVVSKR
jgi:hypothetical protein